MSNRLKVRSEVAVYEIDGEEISGQHVDVEANWNRRGFVVIRERTGKAVTVLADDLRKALENAINA